MMIFLAVICQTIALVDVFCLFACTRVRDRFFQVVSFLLLLLLSFLTVTCIGLDIKNESAIVYDTATFIGVNQNNSIEFRLARTNQTVSLAPNVLDVNKERITKNTNYAVMFEDDILYFPEKYYIKIGDNTPEIIFGY